MSPKIKKTKFYGIPKILKKELKDIATWNLGPHSVHKKPNQLNYDDDPSNSIIIFIGPEFDLHEAKKMLAIVLEDVEKKIKARTLKQKIIKRKTRNSKRLTSKHV